MPVLVPTFLGLSALSANGTVYDASWVDGDFGMSMVGKQGYLTPREIGYALALVAFARGGWKPGWARHIRPDAAVPFRAGLHYLRKTGDTLFHPDTAALDVRAAIRDHLPDPERRRQARIARKELGLA